MDNEPELCVSTACYNEATYCGECRNVPASTVETAIKRCGFTLAFQNVTEAAEKLANAINEVRNG